MKEPFWLSVEIVLAIQEDLLARFGGAAGIREKVLLESAVSRPQQRFYYENPTPFQLAATYAHGIVKNHPFVDGNERAGFMAAYTFLGINGHQLLAPEEEAVLQTLALAAGEADAEEYAAWLQRSCSPRTPPAETA